MDKSINSKKINKNKKVKTIYAKKILNENQIKKMLGKKLRTGYFKTVIHKDTDVYDKDTGELLLRFRKKVLPQKKIRDAYDNLIEFAKKKTQTRGIIAGVKDKKDVHHLGNNKKIMSNIIGYFDTFSPSQKLKFKKAGLPIPKCRETAFTGNEPQKWRKVVPLIKEINKQYRLLFPKHHKKQRNVAKQTPYVIANTAFSTVTTNLNFQTRVHTDKGDYEEGFGNLVVLEKGNYTGGFTGFPQYGIGVNVREGDFLGMNVHLEHGNEPLKGKNFHRLSLVSYLRKNIINKCKSETTVFKQSEINKL